MKKILSYSYLTLFYTGIWLILSEGASLFNLVSGLFFSIIAIFFTNHYLLKTDFLHAYGLKPVIFFRYAAYLFLQIYLSRFAAILKIIKGQDKVKIIAYQTCITDDLAINLLANAITLTPGTVTIDKEGRQLKILSFDDESSFTANAGGQACSKYEMILRGLRG